MLHDVRMFSYCHDPENESFFVVMIGELVEMKV